MNLDDGTRAMKVLDLITRANFNKLIQVELKLPHAEIVIQKQKVKSGGKVWTYDPGQPTPDDVVLFMPDMGIWFDEHDLNRAPDHTKLYGDHSPYQYATELRIKNVRGHGNVGGWIKEATHVRFYFKDKKAAMLFKLTWGGSC